MKTTSINKLKQMLTFVLILLMATHTMAHTAPYDDEARWRIELPIIEPLDIDLSRFPELEHLAAMHDTQIIPPELMEVINRSTRMSSPDESGMFTMDDTGTLSMDDPDVQAMMDALREFTTDDQPITLEMAQAQMERNELSEPPPEVLEEIRQAVIEYQQQNQQHSPYAREVAELALLLSSGTRFSSLSENDLSLIFRHLNITPEAYTITGELFALMEHDGFTLSDSMELIRIMSGGLFGYEEAKTILILTPSSQERISELARFNRFAQSFDIAKEVNARRLINCPFRSTNGFDLADPGARQQSNIELFITSVITEAPYSFIETAQMEEQARHGTHPQEFAMPQLKCRNMSTVFRSRKNQKMMYIHQTMSTTFRKMKCQTVRKISRSKMSPDSMHIAPAKANKGMSKTGRD